MSITAWFVLGSLCVIVLTLVAGAFVLSGQLAEEERAAEERERLEREGF